MPNEQVSDQNQVPSGEQAAPFKSVLIIGKDITITAELKQQFQQEGYLLINGDGEEGLDSDLLKLDYEKLRGNINKDTRIYIYAHGTAEDNIHYLDSLSLPTRDIFNIIAKQNDGMPLNIQLISCYAGAAAPDISALPKGSLLVAHGPTDKSISAALADKLTLQAVKDLSESDLVQDFIQRFAMNVKQTATISILKHDGTIFQHTIRPPKGILTNATDIKRYLEFQRTRFILEYNRNFDKKLDPDSVPPITEAEAIEWRNDNFIYMAVLGHPSLTEALESKIQAFSSYINYSANGTALMWATIKGHKELVSALLKSEVVNVNEKDNMEYTALMWAAIIGHDEVVSALLKSDIEVNAKDKNGYTALMWADAQKYDHVIYAMLASGKIDLYIDDNRNIAARWAARHAEVDTDTFVGAAHEGHDKVVTAMLDSGKIDINAKDSNGYTALMWADRNKHDHVIYALLESGQIDLSIKMNRDIAAGWAARQNLDTLIKAAKKGHDQIVTIMLESGKIDMNAKDSDAEFTAFIWAAYVGRDKVVTAMLKSGKIDVDAKDKYGYTALMWADINKHDHVIYAMLASGRVALSVDKNRDIVARWAARQNLSTFIRAAKEGHDQVISVMLALGEIDMNGTDTAQYTALIWAAYEGRDKVVTTLLASGKVDMNAKDKYDYTALMWAVVEGHNKVSLALIDAGADLDIQGKGGKTVLMLAVERNNFELTEALLKKGADRKGIDLTKVDNKIQKLFTKYTNQPPLVEHAVVGKYTGNLAKEHSTETGKVDANAVLVKKDAKSSVTTASKPATTHTAGVLPGKEETSASKKR